MDIEQVGTSRPSSALPGLTVGKSQKPASLLNSRRLDGLKGGVAPNTANGEGSSASTARGNGRGIHPPVAPGAFVDAQGKPTDDPIPEVLRRCDHCGRPGAKAQDFNGRTVYLHDDCQHRWADAALAEVGVRVTDNGGVTDAQQIEAARTRAAVPVPRQPVLVMERSKEDAGLPPQVVAKQPDAVADVPDQAEKAPPAQPDQPVSTPDPVPATESSDLPPRPPGMPDGDYGRMLQRFRNQKALQQFDAAMKERAAAPR
jgi:hypothetical protein